VFRDTPPPLVYAELPTGGDDLPFLTF